ncbi:MAG: hypothetical protein WB797_12660 [Nocardioides sp.]
MPGFGHQASWLFADVRPAVVTLAMVAGCGFVVAGAAYLLHHDLWAPVAVLSACASLALIVATFTPWWAAAVAIDVVVLAAAWPTAISQLSGR